MLCRFGQLRNSSVFTHFHSLSRTATSSATSKYGTLPETIDQKEEPNSAHEERS